MQSSLQSTIYPLILFPQHNLEVESMKTLRSIESRTSDTEKRLLGYIAEVDGVEKVGCQLWNTDVEICNHFLRKTLKIRLLKCMYMYSHPFLVLSFQNVWIHS